MNEPEVIAKEPWITLAEVWQAYRKAKKEAYYANTAAYGLKFVKFEENLVANLQRVYESALDPAHHWAENCEHLGGVYFVPKSIDSLIDSRSEPHFMESEPLLEWKRTHGKTSRAKTTLRLVIDATVEYYILATLWVLKVGEKYEGSLASPQVYANRLRRRYRKGGEGEEVEVGPVNWESHSLFQSFHYQYGRWRRDGLRASRRDLEKGYKVVGIALDVSSFYDSIDASFLLSRAYLKRMKVRLTNSERAFTEALIRSFATWRAQANRDCGIPIGLPSSGVIANLLLGPFDDAILERLKPSFYGRFVDDIYISLQAPREFKNGDSLLRWLVAQIPWLSKTDEVLEINLPYSKQSRIRLGTKKQRVFKLEGQAGIDVLAAIEEHMRVQASAHRMLPELPDTESQQRENALMLTRDAGAAMAVFREADFVSLRKAGLSEELSKMERIASVLPPCEWQSDRRVFYDLVGRHVLAPSGFFEFFTYIPRIVGLMSASADWEDLKAFLDGLSNLKAVLRQTTELSKAELDSVFQNLAERVQLAALKCCHAVTDDNLERAVASLIGIRKVGKIRNKGRVSAYWLRRYGDALHLCDWGREPFFVSMLSGSRSGGQLRKLPLSVTGPLLIGALRLALTRMSLASISASNWKPMVFPTRPMPLNEITTRLGWREVVGYGHHGKYQSRKQFARFVLALRGVRLNRWVTPQAIFERHRGLLGVKVGNSQVQRVLIAVTSVKTEYAEWEGAARNTPVMTRERLRRLTDLVNNVLRHDPVPNIIVLPELSLPRVLLGSFVQRLGRSGISLIAGMEYGIQGKKLTNQAVVTVDLGMGYGQMQFLVTKNSPAWQEAADLETRFASTLAQPRSVPELPVFRSNGLYFGVLICSDLTNPRYRAHFQGLIDGLFVLEWNQDVPSFASLVEASALDIHTYVIQANNRLFGDSRIRGPLKQSFERDIVRLKGGVHDYFVVGEIDPESLRDYQSKSKPELSESAIFKPYPIGFEMSSGRRVKK